MLEHRAILLGQKPVYPLFFPKLSRYMDYTYGRTILQEAECNSLHANLEHTVRTTEQTCVYK
jgi:hypothetical protein